MNQLLWAMLLAILPVTELRGGLPLAIDYALEQGLAIAPIFILIVGLNILVIWFIFFFLDHINVRLMKIKAYEKAFNFYLERTRKRIDIVEKKMPSYGYLALSLFVAIPLPITGAWTGTFIAWFLGLDRKKSLLALALGVLIAGFVVLGASLGVLNLIK